MIVVFCGLIASGKSTLAEWWAARSGYPCYNSDRVRKELLDIPAREKCPAPVGQGIYSAAMTRRTYDQLLVHAEAEVRAKGGVVLDASYSSRQERARVRQLAERLGCVAFFIHCWCDEQETRRRLALRAEDPEAVSDGRMEIYLQQKKTFEPLAEVPAARLLALETNRFVPELAETVSTWLKKNR